MVTVERARVEHAEGICRVGTASWRDAYADVLATEYVDANVRVRYDPERIAGQIDGSDDTDGIGDWFVALDGEGDAFEGERDAFDREADDPETREPVVGAVRDDRPESGVGEVSSLYVHPDWQGEGVGSQLLETLTRNQRDRGVTEQHTYVFADNDDALSFYESRHFTSGERFAAATVDGVESECGVIGLSRSI